MASIYTDEERDRRNARLRAKKKHLDGMFDVLGWVLYILLGFVVVTDIFMGFLDSITDSVRPFLGGVCNLGIGFGAVYALHRREMRATVFWMIVSIPLGILANYLGAWMRPFVIVAEVYEAVLLPLQREWQRLSQEDGFPLFDVSYNDRALAQKAQEKVMQKRAIAAAEQSRKEGGVFVENADGQGDMLDILDDNGMARIIPEKLTGYQDRLREPARGEERSHAYVPGVMDTLEDIAPPPPPSAPEIQPAAGQGEAIMSGVAAMDEVNVPMETPPSDSDDDAEILEALRQLEGKGYGDGKQKSV